jgi:hypothetical protein
LSAACALVANNSAAAANAMADTIVFISSSRLSVVFFCPGAWSQGAQNYNAFLQIGRNGGSWLASRSNIFRFPKYRTRATPFAPLHLTSRRMRCSLLG